MSFNLITQLASETVTEITPAATDTGSSTTTVSLPTYLIVLICILVAVAIIACIYKIFAYRRASIAAKKIDYLVEDLIYKSEFIMPSIEVIKNLTSYSNWTEFIKNQEKAKSSKGDSQESKKKEINNSKKIQHEEVASELIKSKAEKDNKSKNKKSK